MLRISGCVINHYLNQEDCRENSFKRGRDVGTLSTAPNIKPLYELKQSLATLFIHIIPLLSLFHKV